MRSFRRICVYCGGSNAVPDLYKEAARNLGRLLAAEGITVVYGGGSVGLMGELANAALEAGGAVIGVIPEKLNRLEIAHRGLTEMYVVDGMHPRKMMMSQLADAFIALPGGWGTMEEVFETTTWVQLNYVRKPIGLLNVAGFYDPLLQWIERSSSDGFIRPLHRGILRVNHDPHALLDDMRQYEIPLLESWIDKP